jgi:hypothetical protein
MLDTIFAHIRPTKGFDAGVRQVSVYSAAQLQNDRIMIWDCAIAARFFVVRGAIPGGA